MGTYIDGVCDHCGRTHSIYSDKRCEYPEKISIFTLIRKTLTTISFKIFLWSINKTEDQYRYDIWVIESSKFTLNSADSID